MKKTILTVTYGRSIAAFQSFAAYIQKLTRARQVEFMVEKPPCSGTCKHFSQPGTSGNGMTETNASFSNNLAVEGLDALICEKWTDVIERLRQESRYADLLIIDPATSFGEKVEDLPTAFVKQVLTMSECPVLIAPDSFEGVEDIVLCFDGTASSVFAIKQFVYLFPEYSDKNAIVLHINKAGEKIPEETNSKIRHWLKPHFSSINFHVLGGNVKRELAIYLSGKEKLFVVMGAYGRSLVSSFFRRSAADSIIRSTDLPIFITHH